MRAWLVSWEGVNDSHIPDQKIVAILNQDLSAAEISMLVGVLYASATYTLHEQARWAEAPGQNPYRAHSEAMPSSSSSWRIVCGHDPWLEARIVEGLSVQVDDEQDTETIVWQEPLANGESHQKEFLQNRREGA